MICYAIALHFVWAFLLIYDPGTVNATPVHALYRIFAGLSYYPDNFLAGICFFCSALATLGLATSRPWLVVLLIPQQVLLLMSATGAFEAMWLSQFADGVFRSRGFIIADQIPAVIAAVGHTVAIIFHWTRVSN